MNGYQCLKCKTNFLVPREDVERMKIVGRYIACPFGHYQVIEVDRYKVTASDMKADNYTRKNRRVVQRGWSE